MITSVIFKDNLLEFLQVKYCYISNHILVIHDLCNHVHIGHWFGKFSYRHQPFKKNRRPSPMKHHNVAVPLYLSEWGSTNRKHCHCCSYMPETLPRQVRWQKRKSKWKKDRKIISNGRKMWNITNLTAHLHLSSSLCLH